MNQLSEREMEILKLVAHGLTNKAIADVLCIAEATVENHLHNIYKKINVSNRAQATAFSYREGLVY